MRPIHILVIDGTGKNPASYILGNELARLGLAQLCHLLDPPEEVSEQTFVLVDDAHVVRWRRQPPNYADSPAWLEKVTMCYKVGAQAVASAASIHECALAIKRDALAYLNEMTVGEHTKKQSAVLHVPVHDRQSLR